MFQRPLDSWRWPAGSLRWVSAATLTLAAGLPGALDAQIVDGAVKASQAASVSQTMAEAEITVVFNRPVARGRVLFGNLVPWELEWNPGADQATHIRTTHDLMLAGERLAAGSYSIWVIPRPDRWTVMFHREWDVFHAPYPGDDGVVLRLEIEPESTFHMESLAFYLPKVDRRDGELALHWGEILVRIPLVVPEG